MERKRLNIVSEPCTQGSKGEITECVTMTHEKIIISMVANFVKSDFLRLDFFCIGLVKNQRKRVC